MSFEDKSTDKSDKTSSADKTQSGADQPIGALNRAGIQKSPKELSRDEWARILTPFQFAVLREAHTEKAGSGQYAKSHDPGAYHCAACGAVLFSSHSKFESRCGWPSFSRPESNVGRRVDRSFGLVRTEIYCVKCNSHLGHFFEDGPRQTRERYCVNSAAMEFVRLKNE